MRGTAPSSDELMAITGQFFEVKSWSGSHALVHIARICGGGAWYGAEYTRVPHAAAPLEALWAGISGKRLTTKGIEPLAVR
jgi:hypothetical protein